MKAVSDQKEFLRLKNQKEQFETLELECFAVLVPWFQNSHRVGWLQWKKA